MREIFGQSVGESAEQRISTNHDHAAVQTLQEEDNSFMPIQSEIVIKIQHGLSEQKDRVEGIEAYYILVQPEIGMHL